MSNVTITVDAGVCRFKTIVEAVSDDEGNISFKIKSECPAVRKLAKELKPIPIFDVIATPFADNIIYKEYAPNLEHVACPIPSAIIKAAEVAGDLCLKRDVAFKIE